MHSVSLLPTPPVSPNDNPSISTKMTLPPIRNTSENDNINMNNKPNHIPDIDINILKRYLNQGGSCNIRHPGTGLSLLCWAIKSESMIGIQLLLDHWCSKEDKTKDRLVDLFCFPSKHGVTPIHMLADQGFMQGFYLFEHYYEQQQEQQKGLLKHILLSTSSTPSSSSSSIFNSNSSYIDWLNILDNKGKTPLHYAVQKNQCQAVHYFLYHGASAVIKDQLGHTPLTLALLHQTTPSSSINFDILQLLIHTLNDDSMVTFLQRPHQYALSDYLWYYLFQQHYDHLSLQSNEKKDHWVYLCVFWNRSDILSKLLQYQKENQESPYFKKMKSDDSNNINHHNNDADDLNDNSDPLYLAVQQRKLDIVKQLCQAGYSSKVRSDGFNSCLLYAATHGFLEMIPLLYTPTTSNHCMELCLQLVNPANRPELEQQFNNVMSFNKLLNLDPMNISSIINFDSSF
ncbi:unnamed protein product [Cunninghamella blakesleeana]